MSFVSSCVLAIVALGAEAAQPAARVHVEILAVDAEHNRVAGLAPVEIMTLDGTVVRRGRTGMFGEPYNAEQRAALDQSLKMLRVVVYNPQTGTPRGTALLGFDSGNWRPLMAHAYVKPDAVSDAPGRWVSRLEYDFKTGQFQPLPGRSTAPPRIVVLMSDQPDPADQQLRQNAASSSVPPTGPPTGEAAQAAAADARIVALGRPLTPTLPWADFGRRWTRGRLGMYYEQALLPEVPSPQ